MIFNRPHGEYVLVRKIAAGGMAEIFLARSPEDSLREFVALKCVHRHLEDDRALIRQFYEEGRLGCMLRSPHLVTVHDARLMAGRHTMVMDYAPGLTARDLYDRAAAAAAPLDASDVIELVRQAAIGVHDLHQTVDSEGESLGIIHRDISADNLLVCFDGRVKVIDLGLAETSNKHIARPRDAGKHAYMAPELLRGEPYDQRVDGYALGVVLYELLSGRSPFRRESKAQTIQAIVAGACPPPLPERWSGINEVVLRAMALDPAERYPSAHHLAVELEGCLGVLGVEPQLRARVRMVSREERAELDQQIQKIRLAPRPSPHTIDLTGAVDDDIETVSPEHFAVGDAGIDTTIRRFDAAETRRQAREVDREFTASADTQLSRRGKARRLVVALLMLVVAGASIWMFFSNARDRGWFTEEKTVQLETEPAGALATIEGVERVYTTPATIRFTASARPILTVSKPGYHTIERTLDEETAEQLSLRLTIDPNSPDAPIGSVRVRYAPINAALEVDGRAYDGMSPILVDQLAIGRQHEIRLHLEGFEPLRLPFRLDSRETLELDLRLSEGGPLGKLSVFSEPGGADVLINRQFVGTTPIENLELPAEQSYELTVERAGYSRWRDHVFLGDEEKTINLQLDRFVPTPRPPSLNEATPDAAPPNAPTPPPPAQPPQPYPYELIRD